MDWSRHPDDPATGRALTWGKRHKWDKLRMDGVRLSAADFETQGLYFPDGVAAGRRRMPCSTTPAMDDQGRPAPRGGRGKTPEDAKNRWLAGSRQFAPWHYHRDVMMSAARRCKDSLREPGLPAPHHPGLRRRRSRPRVVARSVGYSRGGLGLHGPATGDGATAEPVR